MAGRTVVCLGDSVVDVLVHVPECFLQGIGAEPGGCQSISVKEMQLLVASAAAQGSLVRTPGGSAANVAKGIAYLCPSSTGVRFVSIVGADDSGAEFRQGLAAVGVEPLLVESPTGLPTSTCLCMVTPGGQRTMRTSLSASKELTSVAQLPGSWLASCGWLHCEGYCLYRPDFLREAMQAARKEGAQVSLDLASFELVSNTAPVLQSLLAEGLVDVLFANEEEAQAFNSAASASPPSDVPAAAAASPTEESCRGTGANELESGAVSGAEATAAGVREGVSAAEESSVRGLSKGVGLAQEAILQYCKVSIVSLGEAGCLAKDHKGNSAFATAERVIVVDTVGAGDNCTAGIIAALLQNVSLQAAVECGCAAGTAAVQTAGGVLGAEAADALKSRVRAIVAGIAR